MQGTSADRTTCVILARHGETAFNVGGRFRGRADPGLTAEGEAQAVALARTLAPGEPTALFVSPRTRAQSTAAAIASRLDVDPITTPLLDDLDYGSWTGKSGDEAAASWPSLHEEWRRDPSNVSFPEGEALAQVLRRVRTFLRFAHDERPSGIVVAVTHDAIIRCAVSAVLGVSLAPYHKIAVGLASTTGVLVTDDGTSLAWLNRLPTPGPTEN